MLNPSFPFASSWATEDALSYGHMHTQPCIHWSCKGKGTRKCRWNNMEQRQMCMQAPVTFAVSPPTGQPGYVVTVTNKNWFTTTEALIFSFRLLADGLPVRQEAEEGWTQFDIAQIPPQVPLPLPFTMLQPIFPFPNHPFSITCCGAVTMRCYRQPTHNPLPAPTPPSVPGVCMFSQC